MLDWMKDKIGRKQSPLQALQAGAFKDEAEKQGLLEALANTEGLKAEDLILLLSHADAGVQQRASSLFLSRATIGGVLALLEAVVAGDATARAVLSKTLLRAKPEHVKPALEAVLKEAKQDRLRTAWEVSMEFARGDPRSLRGARLQGGAAKGAPRRPLRRMMAKRTTDNLRVTLIEALDDREPRVRKLAVDALAKLQGNDIFEAMLDRIVADDNVEVRKVAGGYLQRFIATAPRDLRPAILGRLLLTGDAGLKAQLVTKYSSRAATTVSCSSRSSPSPRRCSAPSTRPSSTR